VEAHSPRAGRRWSGGWRQAFTLSLRLPAHTRTSEAPPGPYYLTCASYAPRLLNTAPGDCNLEALVVIITVSSSAATRQLPWPKPHLFPPHHCGAFLSPSQGTYHLFRR